MNIVKYDAGTAQQKFEQAVTDDIGVLSETDARDIAYYQEQNACSWYVLGNSWNDIRLGASLENILKRCNHPLLTRWFDTNAYTIKDKSSGIAAPIDVYGVRAGINMRNTIPPVRTRAVTVLLPLLRVSSNICTSPSSNVLRACS